MSTLSPSEIQYQLSHQNEDRSWSIIVSITIMLAIAYIATLLRFLSRRLIKVEYRVDDWMMLLGVFLTTLFVVGCYVCVHFGMGRHAILLMNPTAFAKTVLITEVLYTPASTTIKLSILLLYRRLFPNRSLKITSICVAPFLLVFALAQMLSVIIQCSPPAALWDPASYPNAQCDKYAPALLLFAIVNALTDVFILSLPLPILWHLQVSAHQRWRLISVFLLGGLVCVVSICRAGFVTQVSLTDPSWDDINTVILSAIENCAGVLSANLPTMLPLWQYLRHGRVQSSTQPSNQYTRGTNKSQASRAQNHNDIYLHNRHDSTRQLKLSSEEAGSGLARSNGLGPTTASNNGSEGIRITTDFRVTHGQAELAEENRARTRYA